MVKLEELVIIFSIYMWEILFIVSSHIIFYQQIQFHLLSKIYPSKRLDFHDICQRLAIFKRSSHLPRILQLMKIQIYIFSIHQLWIFMHFVPILSRIQTLACRKVLKHTLPHVNSTSQVVTDRRCLLRRVHTLYKWNVQANYMM